MDDWIVRKGTGGKTETKCGRIRLNVTGGRIEGEKGDVKKSRE